MSRNFGSGHEDLIALGLLTYAGLALVSGVYWQRIVPKMWFPQEYAAKKRLSSARLNLRRFDEEYYKEEETNEQVKKTKSGPEGSDDAGVGEVESLLKRLHDLKEKIDGGEGRKKVGVAQVHEKPKPSDPCQSQDYFVQRAKLERALVMSEKKLQEARRSERAAFSSFHLALPSIITFLIHYGVLFPLWGLWGDLEIVMVPSAVTSTITTRAVSEVGSIWSSSLELEPLPLFGSIRSVNAPMWYLLCHVAFSWFMGVMIRR